MSNFTKRAIIESFKKLLNQYPLDKITVTDIVDDCGINRNTFYYHFRDIYDLLDEIIKEETDNVIKDPKSYGAWQDGLIDSLKFLTHNKKAIYHIYHSVRREQLGPYISETIGSLMTRFVREQARGLDVDEAAIRMISDFYRHALIGYMHEWIQNGMKEDTESAIRYLGFLFDGNIYETLKKAEKLKHSDQKY